MMRFRHAPLLALCAANNVLASSQVVLASNTTMSIQLDLSPFYNNKAFGTFPGEASFDSLNQSFPAPTRDTPYYTSTDTGIVYSFPGYTGPDKPDNVICSGQIIPVTAGGSGPYFSASFLVAADVEGASVSANVTFAYTDGPETTYELRSLNWYSFLTIDRGEITFPARLMADGTDYNTSHVFERTAALAPGKMLSSVVLPVTTNATTGRLHVFAVSLWQGGGDDDSRVVGVQSVRPTQKWLDDSGAQIVEVTLNNVGSRCVSGDGLSVSLSGDGFQTVSPGRVKRLCPGDQKAVTVGVEGSSDGSAPATVVVSEGASEYAVEIADVEIGFTNWTSDLSSLAKHESPDWFNDAKYGIFIHWGPYAVTGWGNSTPYESYAEWFWWYSTHHPQADRSDFYNYRLQTYGPDWKYDDTFPDFNASNFDPKEWVDLFADAGAKYFVITTKHHDGFALFDTGNTTNRSSLHYGPKRDLLRELFDAAEKYQPSMKRGTYFSLPEWFNPDFGPYGFDSSTSPSTVSWPGVLAPNPYNTSQTEPYTGRVPINDFIDDLMVPQMETLAYDYGTDIMWCDCGAANGTAGFAARWWNEMRLQDRQVAVNSRCGVPEAADFDTPEYTTFSSAQRRKWESNQGMDPYSYGYNRATPDDAYMDARTVVRTLVDMVSKNGNLLLDVGPRADGSIVQAEVDNLREAGRWIRAREEAIFNTTYWFVRSEIVAAGGGEVRFTQTDGAFYVLFLDKPVLSGDGVVEVAAPIPILEGDEVSLLAVEGGESLRWEVTGEGTASVLKIYVPEALFEGDDLGWVFKVKYA